MNDVTKFSGATRGMRNSETAQYLKGLTFIAEPETNNIIIKGKEEDYLQAKAILDKLDEPQPQVAIEILILSVNVANAKRLGAQIRSKRDSEGNNRLGGLLGDNVTFQTSGLLTTAAPSNIVTKSGGPGVNRLLGDLIELVSGAPGGNTVLSLGRDVCGIWGIFNMFQEIGNTQIISNPFLVATNKQPASVSIGQQRRVKTGTVFSGENTSDTFGNDEAKLVINITPQINNDGFIVLDLKVEQDQFTNTQDTSDATKTTREIQTTTIISNKEVLALGGLIQNETRIGSTKTPLLGQIPVFGWLFKNQSKSMNKTSLLVLITAEISDPAKEQYKESYTQKRIKDYREHMGHFEDSIQRKDPINILFFDKREKSKEDPIENLIFKNQGKEINLPKSDKGRRKRRKRRRNKRNQKKVLL
jgi:general secretion pathway protein D